MTRSKHNVTKFDSICLRDKLTNNFKSLVSSACGVVQLIKLVCAMHIPWWSASSSLG